MKYCIIGHSFFQTKGIDTMDNLVVIQNNQVVVSSKDLAEHFGKEHKPCATKY